MKKFFSDKACLSLALLCACVPLFFSSRAGGAELEKKEELRLISPLKARFSFHSARLECGQTVATRENNGLRQVEFVIPEAAKNLEMSIPGEIIARWTTAPTLLSPSSEALSDRRQIQIEKDNLVANLAAINARLAVWEAQTSAATAQELESRQNLMEREMPALAKRREELLRQLDLANRQLAMLPESGSLGMKVIATLADASRAGDRVEIRYSYDLDNCGWLPQYDFNAITTDSGNYLIKVRLGAEIWQYGGLDWRGTEITLATQGTGPREPLPLRRWIVGEKQPQPRTYEMKRRPLMATATANKAAPDMDAIPEAAAGVSADAAALYATWTLSEKGLPEGKSRVAILEDEWKTNLEWLARPTTEDNRVWLLARCELPEEKAWPAGAAQFGIDGQNVGRGDFTPREREVALYFGADPRVNVATTVNTSKRGQTGFINTSKTWTGSWTYTISNEHEEAVKVKVERPAPMPADEKITVAYKDAPAATVDEKKHMLYWEMETPGHGKAVIEHSVTISSPEDLSIFPMTGVE